MKGRKSILASLFIIAGVVIGVVVLFVGAILLPGSTLASLWSELTEAGGESLVGWALVLVSQLYIMRHFQSVASRSMASRLLHTRTERMRNEVLVRMDLLMRQKEGYEL